MVKARGASRSQPENDPHHTTLHFVHNKNQQKQQASQNVKREAAYKKADAGNDAKKGLGANSKLMAFSASRTSKRAKLQTIALGHNKSR